MLWTTRSVKFLVQKHFRSSEVLYPKKTITWDIPIKPSRLCDSPDIISQRFTDVDLVRGEKKGSHVLILYTTSCRWPAHLYYRAVGSISMHFSVVMVLVSLCPYTYQCCLHSNLFRSLTATFTEGTKPILSGLTERLCISNCALYHACTTALPVGMWPADMCRQGTMQT